jgi:hypothetical protein
LVKTSRAPLRKAIDDGAGEDREQQHRVNWSVLISPSWKGEPVSSRTSQDWATVCIQRPTCERTNPDR